MDTVTVSCGVTSSKPETKKRRRHKRKHMALKDGNDANHGCPEGTCLVKDAHDVNNGCLEGTSLVKDTPLQGGSHVEPAVNTTAESVTMEVKSNTGLSRSQKKRLRRKINKQKRRQENADPYGSSPTIKSPANISIVADLSELSLNSDLCTPQKERKRKKMKLDPHGSSTIGAPADISIATDVRGLSLNSDLCTSQKKRKRKRKRKKSKPDALENSCKDGNLRDDNSSMNHMLREEDSYSKPLVNAPLNYEAGEGQPSVDTCRQKKKVRTHRRKRQKNSDATGNNLQHIGDNKMRRAPFNHSETHAAILSENLLDRIPEEALANGLDGKTSCKKGDKKTKTNNRKEISEDCLTKGVSVLGLPRQHLQLKHEGKLNGFQKNLKEEIKVEEIVPSLSHLRVTEDNIDVDVTAEEDLLPQKSHLSVERAWIRPRKKKLLILDINGLLADIIQGSSRGYKPDFRVAGKAAFKRPHCDDFLHFCFERFNVGVWSSRAKENVNKAINKLMGDLRHNLLFQWNRSHCTKTKFNTLEDKKKPLVFKELRKLWEKHNRNLPWRKGDYDESNTLLLDDSPYKALRNPAHTAIFPYPYKHTNKRDFLLGPGGILRKYLGRLAVAENVQKFVEQNPFGQPAITESHPSWDFYSQVLMSDEATPA